jgi:hypothetical protein
LNLLAGTKTYIHLGKTHFPTPNLDRRRDARRRCFPGRSGMSTQIIKASVSLVAVATSAVSLFAISWIGLALLGF